MRGRHTPVPARRKRTAIALAVVLGLVVTCVGFVVAGPASAATYNFVVNSTAWGGADANPGNGVCSTSTAGTCTLLAAVQESNALNRPAGDVSVTVSSTIATGTLMTGSVGFMSAGAITDFGDYYVIYNVTAPVSIDLGHRLVVNTAGDDTARTAFYLNGADISVSNADQIWAGESSFVFGPNANRVTVDGGGASVDTTAVYAPERFAVFREGAQNITVKNYSLKGFWDAYTDGGLFAFNSFSGTPRSTITIDNINATFDPLSTTCAGCRANVTTFYPWSNTNKTNGLTFKNMTVKNLNTGQRGFKFFYYDNPLYDGSDSVQVTDLTIKDNLFQNNQGYGTSTANAWIALPQNDRLKGTTTISGNKFIRASSGQNTAIFLTQGANAGDNTTRDSTNGSKVYIQDNYFNGYAGTSAKSIQTYQTGLVTVRRNTFGTTSESQTSPSVAEEYSDGPVLYNTLHTGTNYSSNQSIRTWYPSAAASVLTGAAPAGAVTTSNPFGSTPTCLAKVDVAKPTASDTNNTSKPGGSPSTLDLYWTTDRTAEIYLGSVTGVTGTSATVVTQVPVGAYALPDGTATAVNASTGAASGRLRIQTQVEGLAQPESSQYSRTVALSGDCRPALTLNQAAGQNDSTLVRKLHFTLTSSVALDPTTVTAADFGLTATATPDTIDATKINARISAVTAVSGSGNLQYDVEVLVDDSATVKLTLAASKVSSPSSSGGWSNPAAAASTDNAITFVNPLKVSPALFTLVTGEPHGKDYTISVKAGAPAPTSALTFTSTVQEPPGTPALNLSTSSPTIASGGTTSGAITVKAAAGNVADDTVTTISHTVASSDGNYDGLVVGSVQPHLYAVDPTISITKKAYVNVGNDSTPATIVSTGTSAALGSRQLEGAQVCFVYTVTNTSAGTWGTSLTDTVVTDSDTRLGANGVIGTISTLAQGASAKLSACTLLIDSDTTGATP